MSKPTRAITLDDVVSHLDYYQTQMDRIIIQIRHQIEILMDRIVVLERRPQTNE